MAATDPEGVEPTAPAALPAAVPSEPDAGTAQGTVLTIPRRRQGRPANSPTVNLPTALLVLLIVNLALSCVTLGLVLLQEIRHRQMQRAMQSDLTQELQQLLNDF